MRIRGHRLILLALLALPILFAACAKRPATTQAAAPAPTGAAVTRPPAPTLVPTSPATAGPTTPGTGGTPDRSATAATTPGGPGTGATAAPTAAPGARPSPKEFVAVPDLKDIFFDFDKYDIRPDQAPQLDTNAQWLKSNPNHLVLIEGHCDERGTNEYNLALGERRAKATMNYLVSQGVQAGRITIISYGEERPVCMEKNESCWSRNRRSHFLVKPQ